MSQDERGTTSSVSLYCPTCEEWTPAAKVQSVSGSSWCSVCGTELPWTTGNRLDEAIWASTPAEAGESDGAEVNDAAREIADWFNSLGDSGPGVEGGGRDARGRPLVPFGAMGAPLAPYDPEVNDLPTRVVRLANWLATVRLPIPEGFRRAFAVCDSASEVRCAWEIVRDQRWVLEGDRTFTDGVYTLTLQASLLEYRADMLLTGPDLGRGVLLEIDGPTHRLADRARRDHGRTVRLAQEGYGVVRVGSEAAADFGRKVRTALALDRFLPRPGTIPPTPRIPAAASRPRRWPDTDLGYTVEGIPLTERRALVVEWLGQRGLLAADLLGDPRYGALLDLLARCERGAEVVFVHEFLMLSWWQPYDDTSFHDGYDRLEVGRVVEGWRVPVVLEPLPQESVATPSGEVRDAVADEPLAASSPQCPLALLIERPRHHGPLTWEAERARCTSLEAAGYDIRPVAAEDVRDEVAGWQWSSRGRYAQDISDLPARLPVDRS